VPRGSNPSRGALRRFRSRRAGSIRKEAREEKIKGEFAAKRIVDLIEAGEKTWMRKRKRGKTGEKKKEKGCNKKRCFSEGAPFRYEEVNDVEEGHLKRNDQSA